uniref:Uncharacterized protein n=1 Tax=Acanthochromis polyacanthus TaxID=80966 RepID=A0A3Q1FZF7_9TELE
CFIAASCMLKNYLHSWKKPCIPRLVDWVRQMLKTFPLERVAYVRKGREDWFEKTWGPFTAFSTIAEAYRQREHHLL